MQAALQRQAAAAAATAAAAAAAAAAGGGGVTASAGGAPPPYGSQEDPTAADERQQLLQQWQGVSLSQVGGAGQAQACVQESSGQRGSNAASPEGWGVLSAGQFLPSGW